MGFFSSNCEGCGHPLLSLAAADQINVWMNSGVAILEDGTIIKGSYSGYGRLIGEDEDEPGFDEEQVFPFDEATIWHRACWAVAGCPMEYRGPSDPADDQGWFFEDGAHDMAEPGGDQRSDGQWMSDIANRTLERIRDNAQELSALRLQIEMMAKWAWDRPDMRKTAVELGSTALGLHNLAFNILRIFDEAQEAK